MFWARQNKLQRHEAEQCKKVRKRNNNNNCGIFHDEEGRLERMYLDLPNAKFYNENENERDTGPMR